MAQAQFAERELLFDERKNEMAEAEFVPLDAVIRDAVMEWCSTNGGFPIAFTVALDMVDTEGRAGILVTEMDDQPTHRSMGLATYLDAWYRDDAQQIFAAMCCAHDDGDL